MEDTLRGWQKYNLFKVVGVLILVLMEDTLRVHIKLRTRKVTGVLILVLMEDTLREFRLIKSTEIEFGLNPCFNGRYSQRLYFLFVLL